MRKIRGLLYKTPRFATFLYIDREPLNTRTQCALLGVPLLLCQNAGNPIGDPLKWHKVGTPCAAHFVRARRGSVSYSLCHLPRYDSR